MRSARCTALVIFIGLCCAAMTAVESDGPVVYLSRPSRLIRITRCRNVLLWDVTLRNSPIWTRHFDDCENVNVTGISLHNNLLVPNSDGIHCTTCRRVRISDCDISCGDDAIAITTSRI